MWWAISGHIDTLGGVVDLGTSLIRVTLVDAQQTELCDTEGPPIAATGASPPEAELLTWWDITFPAPTACATPAGASLGFGPYDPLLDPSAAAQDLVTASLNGLYLSNGTDLWVVGVAGSQDQFAGVGYPVAAAPLADGAWKIQTLYLIPLAE
jgi:hypothetical protein